MSEQKSFYSLNYNILTSLSNFVVGVNTVDKLKAD